MKETPGLDPKELANGLRKVLNMHGHAFHYRVLDEAREVKEAHDSEWVFEVAEFPIALAGRETRIDFVLRWTSSSRYLIAECKRTDPSLSHWCFLKVPYVARNRTTQPVVFEGLVRQKTGRARSQAHVHRGLGDCYHLGVVMKGAQSGDGTGKRDDIEHAATQVMRGVGGMAERFALEGLVPEDSVAEFVGAVFTTARLWVSDVELTEADIASGELEPDSVELKEVDWLWFQYHRSPSLRPGIKPSQGTATLTDELEHSFSRTIAIVGPNGIRRFLGYEW